MGRQLDYEPYESKYKTLGEAYEAYKKFGRKEKSDVEKLADIWRGKDPLELQHRIKLQNLKVNWPELHEAITNLIKETS